MLIHYWSNGTWCDTIDLDEYLQSMSDDFATFQADDELTYEEIEEIVERKNGETP